MPKRRPVPTRFRPECAPTPATHPPDMHSVPRFRAFVGFPMRRPQTCRIVQAPDDPSHNKNMKTVLKPLVLAAAIGAGFLSIQASHAEAPAPSVSQQRTVAPF